MTNKPVVVAVDGSEHSHRALEWALGAPEGLDAGLLVVHVRSDALQLGRARIESLGEEPDPSDTVLDTVRAGLADRADTLAVRYESLDGPVPDALIAAGRGAQLIAVGARGRGGVASALLGSTSRALASSAPCPVVVVPHHARAEALGSGASTGRVLLGLHPEETGDAVIDFAFRAARRRGVELEVVTAYPVPPSPVVLMGSPAPVMPLPDMAGDSGELAREAEGKQTGRLRPFAERYPEVRVLPGVTPADATGPLVTGSKDAGLVVVGRHRHRMRAESLLMGSVAHTVVHEAECPVAVVPPEPQLQD